MHIGRNICKVRELLNVKQEQLATILNISQQTISKIEQTETLNSQALGKIADALKVPASVILNYDEAQLLHFLSNPSPDLPACLSLRDYLRLVDKIIELYERLLAAKKA